MDLGPAIGPNIDFFSRLACSLYIADLHDALFPGTPAGIVRRREAFTELLETEIPATGDFDLILAWDLLNYLNEKEVRELSRRLGRACSTGAILFAFITTRKTMPTQPKPFRVLAPDKIGYETKASRTGEAPQYKEPDLDKLLPEFTVESTFLLRNGMQEYLFSRRTDA